MNVKGRCPLRPRSGSLCQVILVPVFHGIFHYLKMMIYLFIYMVID